MKIYFIDNIGGVFDERLVSECSSFFPKWRKEQMLKFKFLKGRLQNALGYLLLVYALKQEGVFKELPDFEYKNAKVLVDVPFACDLTSLNMEGKYSFVILSPIRIEPRVQNCILVQNNLKEIDLNKRSKKYGCKNRRYCKSACDEWRK